ncbi:MAG TPA: hypothetical protein VNO17_02120, partial [Actinomycetota bacterium]|nr:hypothetical protein [Actinomycetota bacterium]
MAQGQEVDRLFELPPEGFVAARDALAAELRGAGDAEAAREVRSLRRPTVAAWAVNRLVRGHPEALAELLEAGEELRRAQRAVLSGKRADLGKAAEHRRRALAELTRRAQDLLAAEGREGEATLRGVRDTLEAASVDEEAGRMVRAGRLSKELPAPAGFGDVAGFRVIPGRGKEEAARPTRAGRAEARRAGAAERERNARRARKEADEAAR